MATIQIRDIPDDAYEILRQRASEAGQSLQAYMRQQIIEFAGRRTKADLIKAIEVALEKDPGSGARVEDVVAQLHADRGR